jgi:hypothetical protein
MSPLCDVFLLVVRLEATSVWATSVWSEWRRRCVCFCCFLESDSTNVGFTQDVILAFGRHSEGDDWIWTCATLSSLVKLICGRIPASTLTSCHVALGGRRSATPMESTVAGNRNDFTVLHFCQLCNNSNRATMACHAVNYRHLSK